MNPRELLQRAERARARTAAKAAARRQVVRDVPRSGEILLYASAAAFFSLVLLAPFMLIVEVSADQVQLTGEGSSARQVGYLIILAASIFAALRFGEGWRALLLPWPMLLALGWCWLSLAWAVNPDIGVRRLVLTTIAVWNTFIIVQTAGYERTMNVLRALFVVLLAINFITVLVDPAVGIHLAKPNGLGNALIGNWRGLMGHKNVAGAVCALTVILFMLDGKRINTVLRIAVIVAAGFFLFKAQSKTSAGMLPIALICAWIFQSYDEKIRKFAIPLIMFFTALGWFLYSSYTSVVLANYLNPNFFTGRGQIWSAMLRYAGDNLTYGSGFGSFWNVGADSPIYEYGQGWISGLATGHNGYLDLLVSVGLPGLLIIVFATIIWPIWRLLVSRILPERGAVAVAFLLFCMGHNITESGLLERDAIVGVIMMIAVAIAQNWERIGVPVVQKASGADVFAILARRRADEQTA